MKKIIIVAILSLIVSGVNAQIVKQQSAMGKNQKELDWYNCSFEADGVYGAEVNKAFETLSKKKVKHKPIVAVIGYGVDIEHEALSANLWSNQAEKADGKDNDGNGLVDDINGWNFLGGKDGRVMERMMREGDREWFRLKDYGKYISSDNKTYYEFDDEGNRKVLPAPKNMEEYNYYRNEMSKESPIAMSYNGKMFTGVFKYYAKEFDKEIKAREPNKEKYVTTDLQKCWDKNGPQDSLRNISMFFMGTLFGLLKTDDWAVVRDLYLGDDFAKKSNKAYEDALRDFGNDGRKEIVGDNASDINDKSYGNNVLLTNTAAGGTIASGIIAGKRGVEGRNNPICPDAQIMPLVILAKGGEAYLKDLALSIRYAVNNKADIILLSEQNTLYPSAQRVWVEEALAYAESKGVLVIVPVMGLYENNDKTLFFPNRSMIKGKELKNVMTVSTSNHEGFPLPAANYGEKSVDLFAPGIQVLSTYTGDTYKKADGCLVAGAIVAGVAALIKSYYPELSGAQLRTVLNEGVTLRKGVEVEKEILVQGQPAQEAFLFEQLCLSSGIVNADKAMKVAEKILNSKTK